MALIDDEDPPPAPPELVLNWRCEKWNCLPEAGGLLDQDAGLIVRMISLGNIYHAYSRYRNSVGAEIHTLTVEERIILRKLRDLRVAFQD